MLTQLVAWPGSEQYDVIVIGRGERGKCLARHLAQIGQKVAVIECCWNRGSFPGPCKLRRLTLLTMALTLKAAPRPARFRRGRIYDRIGSGAAPPPRSCSSPRCRFRPPLSFGRRLCEMFVACAARESSHCQRRHAAEASDATYAHSLCRGNPITRATFIRPRSITAARCRIRDPKTEW